MKPVRVVDIELDLVETIRAFFLGASAAVILISLIPAFRDRFLAYGARSSSDGKSSAQQEKASAQQVRLNASSSLLDKAQKWRVPHSWFTSFYITSVSLSVFWLMALPLCRHHLKHLQPYIDTSRAQTPFPRQFLALGLLLIQGVRRLMECISFQSTSSSTMWVGHWLIGMGFYIGMSVAIWTEGLTMLLEHQFTIHDVEIGAPSLRAFVSMLIFLFASGIQHDCHAYLASLKTSHAKASVEGQSQVKGTQKTQYQMPTHPAFSTTVTPHYLAECFIYVAFTILVAPEGHWLNRTLLCATVFVIVNLGVTAVGTRAWYAETFGKNAVQGRWAMIPFVL